MKFVTYQDLKFDKRHGYKIEAGNEESLVVKEMILPGAYGFPPMYIGHIPFRYHSEEINLISQTDYELTEPKRREIIRNAIAFLYPPDELG